ncbi:uncharacterized protein LOC132741850 [Ruditapes philippinarum]|uniref:uncharacterized protein LOC132741850 n=1 Tax=Ruditapes philippinarum TaxID=129788 RepID=UPI00295AEBBA|nr:uncharacterized protein LOC132741850 [Ruditapes philippinarum]
MERNIKTFVLFCLLIRVPLLCDILPEKRKLDRLISTRSTCSTSKSCPPQRNYELWHSHCKHSCLDGERYICLENEDGEPITEFCAPASLKCEPGTKGVFTIDNNDHTKVVMTVTPCPQDRYQQHSSNCTNACKGNRGDFTGLPEEFVIYSNGSSVEPPKVYCNYTAGYYNPDNSFLFPYDDSFIHYYGPYCIHVNDSDPCSKGMMPLPNSSCVEPCFVGYVRDDHDNFICKPQSINPVNVDGKYLTTQLTTVFQSTTEGNKNQSWTSRYIFVIIGGVVVVVVIGLIIFLCCLWKRKQKNGNNYSDGNREGIEEEVQPLQDIEGETPADKSEEEIAFINEANGKIANGTGALPKKEGTMANGTDALPKEGTMANGTDALPKEGTMVNGTDALPKEGTMVNGTDALPNKEGTMVNGTDALPKEGTMPNGTDALPKEGTMVNGTDALPKEGTMVNGTDALPKEGKMVNGTDALPKEGTMVNGTGALPNKEGTMVNGTDALPKKEGTMPNGTNAIPKKEGTRANDKNRNIKDAEDQVPLQDTKVNSDINKNIKGAGEQVPLQDTEACAEVNSEKRPLKRRNGKTGELKKTYNDTLTPTILNALNSQAESVGCLICEEGIAGTVFKVGTNHAMTACHVVYFIIRIDKNGPNENGNFDWSQLTSDSVYVNFNELITDKPRKVSKVTCVYFNEHLDVAVLKFEECP